MDAAAAAAAAAALAAAAEAPFKVLEVAVPLLLVEWCQCSSITLLLSLEPCMTSSLALEAPVEGRVLGAPQQRLVAVAQTA